MDVLRLRQFFAAMSRDPEILEEFVALAGRHGFDILAGEISEADLGRVSGGVTVDTKAAEEIAVASAAHRDSQRAAILDYIRKMDGISGIY